MLTLNDVDVRCDDGWIPIIQRMLGELNAASLQIAGIVCDEDQGRLRVDYNSNDDFLTISKIIVLAQCRAYYTCEVCGKPGEHRHSLGRKSTRCAAHQTSNDRAGRHVWDLIKTPWRQMPDGRWTYDPVSDQLIRVTK